MLLKWLLMLYTNFLLNYLLHILQLISCNFHTHFTICFKFHQNVITTVESHSRTNEISKRIDCFLQVGDSIYFREPSYFNYCETFL